MTERASVVVVNWNGLDHLQRCLPAVAAQTFAEVDVILVDNGSTDGSVDWVAERFPAVSVIANDRNLGFAAANNRGADLATAPTLLFLNSDTQLSRDALVSPLGYLAESPDVGALTVQLVYPDGRRDPDNHRGFPTPWNALCHFSGLSRLFPNDPRFNGYFVPHADFSQTHDVDVIAGSYMMMPRAVFDELQGWDETYFFYGEDIDLCYRVHEAGYRIVYFPHVEVLHYKGASSGLRKESADIARPPRETRVRVAQESVRAMKVFYRKFYREKYHPLVTGAVLAGIQARGWLRVVHHQLRR